MARDRARARRYNAIRVYIAAYVWMTGYGNFLYYSKTGNFGAVRLCQTLFRLNFFVTVSVQETPRKPGVFGLWRGLSLGRIDSGSFLGTG